MMNDEKNRYDSYTFILADHGSESDMYIHFILFLYMITYRAGNYYLERECLSPPESLLLDGITETVIYDCAITCI